MKKHYWLLACCAALAILSSSCANNAVYKASRESAVASSKESSTQCFVQHNDGSINYYQTLELVTGPFKTPYLLADGKIKIKASEIVAYQSKRLYAVSQKSFFSKKKSKVATETLPGFAVRMAKGRLNVYCVKTFNGQNAVDKFFIQTNDGKILPYTSELFSEVVKDNPQAYEFFTSEDNNSKLAEKISATARIYNTGTFATTR